MAVGDWDVAFGKCSICGEENVRSIPFNAGYATFRPDGKIDRVDRWECIHVTDEEPRDLAAEIDALKEQVDHLMFVVLGVEPDR